MNKRTPVSSIMTANPHTVNTTNKLEDAYQIMMDHNVHHVPVVSGDSVIGMISKTDIDKVSFVTGIEKDKALTAVFDILKIENVMTKNVKTVQTSETIKTVAETFSKGKFHSLPVLDGDKITGIVTSTDIINYLIAQY